MKLFFWRSSPLVRRLVLLRVHRVARCGDDQQEPGSPVLPVEQRLRVAMGTFLAGLSSGPLAAVETLAARSQGDLVD